MSTVATVDMADESTNTLEPEQHLLNAIDRQRKTFVRLTFLFAACGFNRVLTQNFRLCRLTNLRESKERLTALSKSIHAVEVNDGQAFLRAARTAKQLQNDLNEISRRIA